MWYDLKIDKKLFFHYLISVGIHPMVSNNAGKVYLKHGPVKFTNDDIKVVQNIAIMSTDKLYKTTTKEAIGMFGCQELISSIWAIQVSSSVNQCTIHHFSSEFEFPDDFWESFVDRANYYELEKGKLLSARIRSSRGF